LRVLGRSEEAEAIMRSAWEYLAKGTGDPVVRASVFSKAASLLIFQGRFPAASEHAQEAAAIFDELGMKHDRARAQLVQSVVYNYSGDPDRAAHLLAGMLPRINPAEDASLLLGARINLIHSYLLLKQTERALAIYEAQEPCCNRKQTIVLNLKWQRGRLF